MRTLKRVAAVLCSATILTGIGTAAFVVNAQETVPLKDRESEFDTDVVNIIADQVYAEPGEKVAYNVYLQNNKATGGYSGSGLVLVYDERLTPAIKAGTEDIPEAQRGPAVDGLLPTYSLNTSIYTFAASTAGSMSAVCDNDGIYVTTWFTVPADAKEGDTFPVKLTVSRWLDNKNEPISYYPISGWIAVKKQDTTTSTTTTETTTSTTTTETTTSTTDSTTTTTDTTTSTSTTDTTTSTTESTTTTTQTTTSTTETTSTTSDTETGSTSSTTESSTTTESTSSDTTSTDTTTSTTETTSNTKPGTEPGTLTTEKTTAHVTKPTTPNADDIASTTKAPGASTGDAGVGVAVAALALAAGVAVVSGIKRKEQ